MKIPVKVDVDKFFVQTSYQARMINHKTSKVFYEDSEVLRYTRIPVLGINAEDFKIVHIPTGNSLWENTKSLEEAKDFLLVLYFYVGEELLYKILDTLLFSLEAIEKNATNYFDGQVAERGKELRFLVSELFISVQQKNLLMIQVYITKIKDFYK